jgi:hypothetical protein
MDQNKKKASQDNEIELSDIFVFVKYNIKIIATYTILGLLLGIVVEKYMPKIFEGKALIIPLKSNDGKNLLQSKLTLTKMEFESFYSKKTIEECINKSEEKLNSSNPNNTKAIPNTIRSLNSSEAFEITIENTNKDFINSCLSQIGKNILESQANDLKGFMESKENIEKKINDNIKKIELNQSKLNSEAFSSDLLKQLINLYSLIDGSYTPKKDEANIYVRVYEKKTPVSKKQMGLFLGLCVGVLISLLKKR